MNPFLSKKLTIFPHRALLLPQAFCLLRLSLVLGKPVKGLNHSATVSNSWNTELYNADKVSTACSNNFIFINPFESLIFSSVFSLNLVWFVLLIIHSKGCLPFHFFFRFIAGCHHNRGKNEWNLNMVRYYNLLNIRREWKVISLLKGSGQNRTARTLLRAKVKGILTGEKFPPLLVANDMGCYNVSVEIASDHWMDGLDYPRVGNFQN